MRVGVLLEEMRATFANATGCGEEEIRIRNGMH